MAENELLGPPVGTAGAGPLWWKPGRRVKRKVDGQAAIASFTATGEPMVLLARGIAGTMRMAVDVSDWEEDDERVTLTPLQIAKAAWEADRAVRTSLGEPGIPEFSGLHEQQRLQWMWLVMGGHPVGKDESDYSVSRTRLSAAIVAALKGPLE